MTLIFRDNECGLTGIRIWLGKHFCKYSKDRKENLKYLYPYENIDAMIKKKQKIWGSCIYFGFIGVNIIAVILLLVPQKSGRIIDDHMIERQDDDGTKDEVTLYVTGGDLKKKEMIFNIPEKLLTGDNKEKLFEDGYEYVLAHLTNADESLDEVRTKLCFTDQIPQTSMYVAWHTDMAKTVLDNGELLNTELSEDGTQEQISFDLIYGDDVRTYFVNLHIFPPKKSKNEILIDKIYEYAADKNNASKEQKIFDLPMEIDGVALIWEEDTQNPMINLIFISIIALFVGLALEKEHEKEQLKERKQLLEEAYPEFVHKIVLLTSSGMNMKNALLTMVSNEEQNEQKDPLVCEIKRMLQMMHQGISEIQAYESFGKRCQNASYLKLSTLMIQCTKKGAKGMSKMMEDAANEAMLQRREQILRKGEQISTKLLLPMGLLLVIVMIVLIVPAFLSMRI